MQLCSNGHEEVCYKGKECPVCAVIMEREIAKTLIRELEFGINIIEANL